VHEEVVAQFANTIAFVQKAEPQNVTYVNQKVANHIKDRHNKHHGVVDNEIGFRLLAIEWYKAYNLRNINKWKDL